MSCPDYYRTADGREFWQWYRDQVIPVIADEFNHSQHHALQSACEYLFRAGVKTSSPLDDYRKAFSLIERVISISDDQGDYTAEIASFIETAVGKVMFAKMRKEVEHQSKAVSLTDRIETVWGTIK